MGKIKAVLFDLHGTLTYVNNPVTVEEISTILFSKNYDISPQQLRAAWSFVSFIDYPRYGYKNCHSYWRRIFWRLKVKVDEKTLNRIINLLKENPY